MVCKENVESWFRNLSSHNRIDVMCNLLNMCLPFEVRYLGTYVEDRGRRDYNDLRDTEHHANNSSDINELSTLGVSDTRTRRKLILYISLLHGCNYSCAEILYKILASLEDQEIDSILSNGTVNQEQKDEQPLEELLLLYTMAHYHPSFSFEQKRRVGDILEKLQKEEAPLSPQVPTAAPNDRLEGAVEMPANCVMPPSPLPQYPPEVQLRQPIMSGVPPGITMPPPGLCMPPGSDQMSMGGSTPQYLPLGFPSAVSPMAPWQNQTVMMTPMNQMIYPTEIPGYPTSPLVSRQSSPSQSRSPSRSNSPMSRRNNANPPRWTYEERKDMSSQQSPQLTSPMATVTSSSQSNIASNSGTSSGHMGSSRSAPSQRIPTRESSMTYSRHNSSDSVNVATATSIDNKSSKQPPPPRLPRASLAGDSVRESGKELPNFKGNLPNYSHEEIRRLSDEDLRDLGLTPNAVGQLRNIVRSQTTNGLSSQAPDKKSSDSSVSLHHPPPPSPLPPPDCDVVQPSDQLSETNAMKPSPIPQPLPDLYQPMLHHHHHHHNSNHTIGGMRRYPTMPPLDHSQIPQMYTTPPPALYPGQNPCYACYPVSGMQTRFTRCPSQHVYCLTHLQTLRLDDSSRQGSQSSSSDSTGSRSPPETPPAAPWINPNTTTTVMSSPTSTGSSTTSSMTPGATQPSSTSLGGQSIVPTSVMTTATATTTTLASSDGYNLMNPEHNQGSIMSHQGGTGKWDMGNPQQMNERPKHRKGHMMRHKNHMMNGTPTVNMAPCVSAFPVTGHSQMAFLPHGHVSLRPNAGLYPSFPGYRPSYPGSFQPNGEIMFPYPPPTTGGTPPPATMPSSTVTVVVPSPTQQSYMPPAPVVPFTATVQQTKVSCYNCGSSSHHPGDCKDQTMEDLTKRAPYRLDYSAGKQPLDCPNDK